MVWKNTDNPKKEWSGDVGEEDDFGYPITDEFIDGQTKYGKWAIMSPQAFKFHGVGLGSGKGQRYKKEKSEKLFK